MLVLEIPWELSRPTLWRIVDHAGLNFQPTTSPRGFTATGVRNPNPERPRATTQTLSVTWTTSRSPKGSDAYTGLLDALEMMILRQGAIAPELGR